MEDYKEKIIENEKESQRLIEALKGLEDNAKALSDAKEELQSTSKKIGEFLGTIKSLPEESLKLTQATKELNVPELIKRQQRLEAEFKARLQEQTESVNAVSKKLNRIEISAWLILAALTFAAFLVVIKSST
jgi:hypothetical protein